LKPDFLTRQAERMTAARKSGKPEPDWKKVGPCLYRYKGQAYYGLVKHRGKQIRDSKFAQKISLHPQGVRAAPKSPSIPLLASRACSPAVIAPCEILALLEAVGGGGAGHCRKAVLLQGIDQDAFEGQELWLLTVPFPEFL